MTTVNLRELKAHLSEFIERVEQGERVIVAKHNEPVAELRPLEQRKRSSVFGNPVEGFRVPAAFFEPLPDEVVKTFADEHVV